MELTTITFIVVLLITSVASFFIGALWGRESILKSHREYRVKRHRTWQIRKDEF